MLNQTHCKHHRPDERHMRLSIPEIARLRVVEGLTWKAIGERYGYERGQAVKQYVEHHFRPVWKSTHPYPKTGERSARELSVWLDEARRAMTYEVDAWLASKLGSVA